MKTIFESNFWVRILKFEEVIKAQQNKHCCNLIKFGKFWRLTFQFSPWSQLHKSKVGKITNLSSQINETSISEYFRVATSGTRLCTSESNRESNIWRDDLKALFLLKRKTHRKSRRKSQQKARRAILSIYFENDAYIISCCLLLRS